MDRGLLFALFAGACFWVGCGQAPSSIDRTLGGSHIESTDPSPTASISAPRQTLDDAPPALRAAVIAEAQRNAGDEYAVREGAGTLRAKAQGFSVRYDASGAHLERTALGPGAAPVRNGARRGALSLERFGCVGATERVSAAAPSFNANRVAYPRKAAGVEVEEWYLTGPMGLEQGFTIAEQPACAAEGAELVLEVSAEEFAVRVDGDALSLEGPLGSRYRYSDLFAKDANGDALTSHMTVNDGRIVLNVDTTGARFPVEVDPLVVVEHTVLIASDHQLGEEFGYSVALSGDTALVGAKDDSDQGNFSGSAYVFTRSGTTWTQQQKLLAPGGAPYDRFGYSVALSGDTLVVGVPYDDDNGIDSGSAYVFVRSAGVWTLQHKLLASDGAQHDDFGVSVAVDGDTALVGALYGHVDDNNTGSAYVFVRSGATWFQQGKLKAADGSQRDKFGLAVALDGDTALVGARSDDDKGDGSGSAYVFVRSGATWAQQAKLLASDGASHDVFGRSVAVDGDTALVGANADDDVGLNSGSAYIFVRSSAIWTQQQKLTASDGLQDLRFGASVALKGDIALVGSSLGSVSASNSAYVFRRSANVWSEELKLVPSQGINGNASGKSVALDADTALVGANADDVQGHLGGSAHVFTLRSTTGDPCNKDSQCLSGFCTDGVCCATACAGGSDDCQACSIAAGSAVDGTCGPTSGNACNDGDACTRVDTCHSGVCTGGNPITCAAQDECHEPGTCEPKTGHCSSPPKRDGSVCTDGTCQAGRCEPQGMGGTSGAAGGCGAHTGSAAGCSTGGASGAPTGGSAGSGATSSGGYSTGGSGGTGGIGCAFRTPRSERDGDSSPWLLALIAALSLGRRRANDHTPHA